MCWSGARTHPLWIRDYTSERSTVPRRYKYYLWGDKHFCGVMYSWVFVKGVVAVLSTDVCH